MSYKPVDKDYLRDFETANLNPNSFEGHRNLIEAAIIISHEDVHYGVDVNNKTWPASPWINDEPGDSFERSFGRLVRDEGGRIDVAELD